MQKQKSDIDNFSITLKSTPGFVMISKLLEFMSKYIDTSIDDISLTYDLFSRSFWDIHQEQLREASEIENELGKVLQDNKKLKQLYDDIHSYKKKYHTSCVEYEKNFV